MSDGVPGHLVLNRKVTSDQTRKEGRNPHPRGSIGQLGRTSGRAGVGTLWATKNPAGVNLRGLAGVIGLLTIAR